MLKLFKIMPPLLMATSAGAAEYEFDIQCSILESKGSLSIHFDIEDPSDVPLSFVDPIVVLKASPGLPTTAYRHVEIVENLWSGVLEANFVDALGHEGLISIGLFQRVTTALGQKQGSLRIRETSSDLRCEIN